mmetsp:Transcript_1422/g.3019  ORF Transcript_1422/g.3019 Transcript_1422/m.3019 type:complete len:200 (+) Transcript_1422:303-902(+)
MVRLAIPTSRPVVDLERRQIIVICPALRQLVCSVVPLHQLQVPTLVPSVEISILEQRRLAARSQHPHTRGLFTLDSPGDQIVRIKTALGQRDIPPIELRASKQLNLAPLAMGAHVITRLCFCRLRVQALVHVLVGARNGAGPRALATLVAAGAPKAHLVLAVQHLLAGLGSGRLLAGAERLLPSAANDLARLRPRPALV